MNFDNGFLIENVAEAIKPALNECHLVVCFTGYIGEVPNLVSHEALCFTSVDTEFGESLL